MTGKRIRAYVAAVALLALGILPVLGQNTGIKIKVSVENASLRVKPNMDSEVLEENIPLGTVFDQANKMGEWYEVKYQSKLGVVITGYIHEMFVEVVTTPPTSKPALPPEKPAAPPAAQPKAPAPSVVRKWGRVEFGVAYGPGFGVPADAKTSYFRNVAVLYLLNHEEGRGTLNQTLKSPQSLVLSFGYFFPSGLGLQLRADVNFKQTFSGSSVYNMNWTWFNLTTGSFQGTYPLSGEESLTPLSFDLVYRPSVSPVFHPYFGAGLTYFFGNFKANSQAGFPFWFLDGGWQYVDYILVPIKIDQSLSGFGGNFQAGFDIYPTANFGLTLGAIYFLGKEFSLNWTAVPGSYPLGFHTAYNATIPQAVANEFSKNFTALKVYSSHFQLVAGVKVGF